MNLIREELRDGIGTHLSPYLKKCHHAYFHVDDGLIELLVNEDKEDASGRVIIRMCILDESMQLHIPNISFPLSWRGNGDGMKLIDIVYRTAKRHGYALFLTCLTTGFHSYLVGCGAHITDGNTVEILDTTRLVKAD